MKNDDGDDISLISVNPVARNRAKANATITVMDENENPVSGFVNLTVEGGDSVVFTASNLKTHRAKLKSDGTVEVEVSGLPKTGPFKIKITAEIGGLTLTKNIVRTGDAEIVEATAYLCVEDDSEFKDNDGDEDTPDTVADADICNVEIANANDKKAGNDPDEVVALGPEDAFFISAKATDSAGNKVEDKTDLSWAVTANTDNEDDAKTTIEDADQGRTDNPIIIAGGNDAIAGTYSITVTSEDREASTMIMIIVSNVASVIEVTCDPEMIPVDTGLTDCTVTVTDANGNVPSNLHEDGTNMVRVAVRSTGRASSSALMPTMTYRVWTTMGMATFSILLREDAAGRQHHHGQRERHHRQTMALQANSTVVTYGDAPSEPVMEHRTDRSVWRQSVRHLQRAPFNEGQREFR